MFWFCLVLTAITYPAVFLGSCVLLVLVIVLGTIGGGSDIGNPFISPNTLYKWYRRVPVKETFRGLTFGMITLKKWVSDLKIWYRKKTA